MIPVTLTIAGSDSGGGAGIQADLKTFQELETFGMSVITALTAQNSLGVHGVFPTPREFVLQQLDAVLTDFPVAAVKTGMLFSSDIIKAVADRLSDTKIPLIIDPVMIAKGGSTLLLDEAIDALIHDLIPIATIITPNIPEASVLSGIDIHTEEDIDQVASILLTMGPKVVVMKGGHLQNELEATDRIYLVTGETFTMSSKRIPTKNTHGTGCTFSAALTACIAKGMPVQQALVEAKKFIQLAIAHDLGLGHGHGPTNHFAYKRLKDHEVISLG